MIKILNGGLLSQSRKPLMHIDNKIWLIWLLIYFKAYGIIFIVKFIHNLLAKVAETLSKSRCKNHALAITKQLPQHNHKLYDFRRLFLSTYHKKRDIRNGNINGKEKVSGSIPDNGSKIRLCSYLISQKNFRFGLIVSTHSQKTKESEEVPGRVQT